LYKVNILANTKLINGEETLHRTSSVARICALTLTGITVLYCILATTIVKLQCTVKRTLLSELQEKYKVLYF